MNPVLLKPTSERAAQWCHGRPSGVDGAVSYQHSKAGLVQVVDDALDDLRTRFDVWCARARQPGGDQPARARPGEPRPGRRAGLPALVVGDIDRGGVFAHLLAP